MIRNFSKYPGVKGGSTKLPLGKVCHTHIWMQCRKCDFLWYQLHISVTITPLYLTITEKLCISCLSGTVISSAPLSVWAAPVNRPNKRKSVNKPSKWQRWATKLNWLGMWDYQLDQHHLAIISKIIIMTHPGINMIIVISQKSLDRHVT